MILQLIQEPMVYYIFSLVLQQVKKFLPQMETAQQELITRLKTEPENSFDIENVDDCEKVIEMVSMIVKEDSVRNDHFRSFGNRYLSE